MKIYISTPGVHIRESQSFDKEQDYYKDGHKPGVINIGDMTMFFESPSVMDIFATFITEQANLFRTSEELKAEHKAVQEKTTNG